MEQYIPKAVVVAEIEKIIADETESIKSFEHSKNVSEVQRSNARIGVLTHLCSLLDTLETKEEQKEPVSEELEKVAQEHATKEGYLAGLHYNSMVRAFKAGAKWQKEHSWKPADGKDLPEYEREVVVFTQDVPNDAGIMKVAIAHRPNPKGFDGKNIATGAVEHYTPKTYGKDGWNIPDVIFWLDVDLTNLDKDEE